MQNLPCIFKLLSNDTNKGENNNNNNSYNNKSLLKERNYKGILTPGMFCFILFRDAAKPQNLYLNFPQVQSTGIQRFLVWTQH